MPDAIYRFDRFVLDLAKGALLTTDGTEVPLRAKSFALLRFFVENPGRLHSRTTLLEAIWPGVVVIDDSLTQCVGDIRRALRDAGHMLRTVTKRGYVFNAEVRRETARIFRHGRPIEEQSLWHESSNAGRALRGWAVAKVLTLGRDNGPLPRWRTERQRDE
jgi:DNA-binding winged helix-turn-helix (wHTH) protein